MRKQLDTPSLTTLEALKAKYKVPEIATKYRVTVMTVYNWYRRRGITPKGNKPRFTKHDVHLIRELHGAGLKPREIAEKFDEFPVIPDPATIRDIINGRTYRSY